MKCHFLVYNSVKVMILINLQEAILALQPSEPLNKLLQKKAREGKLAYLTKRGNLRSFHFRKYSPTIHAIVTGRKVRWKLGPSDHDSLGQYTE
jgi:hypothetical protein